MEETKRNFLVHAYKYAMHSCIELHKTTTGHYPNKAIVPKHVRRNLFTAKLITEDSGKERIIYHGDDRGEAIVENGND